MTRRVLSLCVLGLLAAASGSAQEYRGRVQGVVTDDMQAMVEAAKVTLRNDGTGVEISRLSTGDGRYLFDYVDPGHYTITVEKAGFSIAEQKNVLVQTRGDVTVNVKLKIGTMEEVVSVTEAPVAVQFNTGSKDLTIERKLVEELPVISRHPFRLALLDPAVTYPGNRAEISPYHAWSANSYDLGGGTYRKNDLLLDGTPLTAGAKVAYVPPMEAVSEFTIQQNSVDAEYGHSAGGTMSLSLRSGTNEVHGSAYYTGRTPGLNAISNRVTRRHSKDSYNVGGGTIGMPLKKNKLFLFTAFEASRTTEVKNIVYTLPTALERQGDFSQSFTRDGRLRVIYDPWSAAIDANGRVTRTPFPDNRIPANRLDPLALKLLKDLWLPNGPGDDPSGTNNFKALDERTYNFWNLSSRVDWQINERWKSFFRLSRFHTIQDMADYTGVNSRMRAAQESFRHGWNVAADTVYTFNSSTALNVRGAFFKVDDRFESPGLKFGEEGYAELWPSAWWQSYTPERPAIYFPNLNVTGATFSNGQTWWHLPAGYSAHARLSKYLRRHSLKAGTEIRWKRGEAARFSFGTFNFGGGPTANTSQSPDLARYGNPWASFLVGAMDDDSNAQYTPLQKTNTEMYAFYVQDDFRVTDRLTVNLGLRYEYEGGFWDPQNRISRFLDLGQPIPEMQANPPVIPKDVAELMKQGSDPARRAYLFNGAWQFTDDENRRGWRSYKYSFMPRIGVALRLNETSAFRAGYARFFLPPELADDNDAMGQYNYEGFAQTTRIAPALQGVPQARFSEPFPQNNAVIGGVPVTKNPLLAPVGKRFGPYTGLGGSLAWDEYEQRSAINDRINVSFQKEVWGRTVVDLTYFVNFGSRQPYTLNINMMDPQLGYTYKGELDKTVPNPFYNYLTPEKFPGSLRNQASVRKRDLLKPYPQYGSLNQTNTAGRRNRYQALQFRLQRPFHKGLAFVASYNYSRSRSQEFFNDLDEYARRFTWIENRSPRHRWSLAGTWELPVGKGRRWLGESSGAVDTLLGGWQVSGIFSYNSGEYLRFGSMKELAPGTSPKRDDPKPGTCADCYWFDPTVLTRAEAFTPRTNPWQYDGLTGPSYSNLDLTLGKNFKVGERVQMELRVEAYNALNNVNWANPSVDVSSTQFGRTNALLDNSFGRQIQYSMKLRF